jgi:hypothetical protein
MTAHRWARAAIAAAVGALAVAFWPGGPAGARAVDTCAAAVRGTPNAWRAGTIGSATETDWYRYTTASRRHVLVTLGGLTGNLSLGLYDSGCRRLALSNSPGTHFEQLYRLVAKGTYYVRVAGGNGATGSYDLRFTPLPNRVLVLSSRAFRLGGKLYLPGEVLNNTGSSVDFLEVVAVFYNKAGAVVGVSWADADTQATAPWHRAPFGLVTEVPTTYDHYRLMLDYLGNADPVVHHLRRTLGTRTPVEGGTRFTGAVVNGNTFPVTELLVAAVAYDSHGRIREEGAYQVLRTIPAGASARYDFDIDGLTSVPAGGVRFYVSGRRAP